MCLIIIREPNVVLDKKKFDTAVMNNPDGWGISIPDMEGELQTIRSVDGETNADELYEWLHDELKADKFMLHLRYTTAGETILRNAHPFPVLELKTDGVDLRMAHNGTLSNYKPSANANNKWESDTRVFNRQFIRPLFKRMIKGHSSEEILTDKFIDDLINSELTSMSVVSFIDGYGNTSVVNAKGNGGFVDDDGTYFSNDYSFDEDHRKSWGGYTMGKTQAGTTTTPSTGNTSSGSKTSTDGGSIKKFSEKMEMDNVEDLFLLSDDTIHTLVQEEVELAEDLIKELISLWYTADMKHTKATRTIAAMKRRINVLEKEKEDNGEADVRKTA